MICNSMPKYADNGIFLRFGLSAEFSESTVSRPRSFTAFGINSNTITVTANAKKYT